MRSPPSASASTCWRGTEISNTVGSMVRPIAWQRPSGPFWRHAAEYKVRRPETTSDPQKTHTAVTAIAVIPTATTLQARAICRMRSRTISSRITRWRRRSAARCYAVFLGSDSINRLTEIGHVEQPGGDACCLGCPRTKCLGDSRRAARTDRIAGHSRRNRRRIRGVLRDRRHGGPLHPHARWVSRGIDPQGAFRPDPPARARGPAPGDRRGPVKPHGGGGQSGRRPPGGVGVRWGGRRASLPRARKRLRLRLDPAPDLE